LESIVPPSLRAVYELKLAGSGDEDVKAGNTYAKMGAFGDAAERFAVATARSPKDHAALYNLGVMQISLNKQDDAADHLQKALALEVDENYVWAQEVLRQLGSEETPRKAEKHEKERGPVIKKP
jgi:tetratricopeptide (TPR) repeat protein